MIEMVMHNGPSGVISMMAAEHYSIYRECYVPAGENHAEVAMRLGVKWYVFIKRERAIRTPKLAGLVTATWEDLEGWKRNIHITLNEMMVPLCSGPQYWDAEAKFVSSYNEFMGLVSGAYQQGRV